MNNKEQLGEIKEKYTEVTVLEYINDVEIVGVDIKDLVWLINRVEELELELELEKSINKDFEAHLLKQVESAKAQNERYKQALEYIQRAIYTQHCTKNHKWNTEFEKGQISGLIQASNIVDRAIRKVEGEV